MMRKLILTSCFLGMCFLSACTPEDANSLIDIVENTTGKEIDYEVTQEDIDKVNKVVDELKDVTQDVADTVNKVITDEEVKQNVSSLIDSVKDAVSEENNEE